MLISEREIRRVRWEKALEKCVGWVTDGTEKCDVQPLVDEPDRTAAALPPGLFFLGTALLVIIADKLRNL